MSAKYYLLGVVAILMIISLLNGLAFSTYNKNESLSMPNTLNRHQGAKMNNIISTADFYTAILCIGETLGNGKDCKWNLDCMMGNSTLRKLNDNYDVASHCLANQRSLKNVVTSEVMQMQLATSKINLTGTTGSMPLVWISLSVFGASSMLIDFIVYHRLLGVGKNIIYDESKDKELLLKPFIDAKIVLYFLQTSKAK